MKLNIIYKPIEEINKFEKNPKIHSEEQIKKIAESITKFGFITPIVIDNHDTIVSGHGRYLAAQKLQLKEVPIIQVEHLSQKEIDAFRIFDNKSNELSTWDELKLSETLKDLDLNLLNLTGFSESEISRYKNQFNFEDIANEMKGLEEAKKEEVEFKAKLDKKDYEQIKNKLTEIKDRIGIGKFYSDYANGKVLLGLMEEIIAGFKQPSEVSGYFESYEANQMKSNGQNLLNLVRGSDETKNKTD